MKLLQIFFGIIMYSFVAGCVAPPVNALHLRTMKWGSIACRSCTISPVRRGVVKDIGAITASDLLSVLEGKISIVRLPNFVEKAVRDQAVQKIFANHTIGEYLNAEAVRRVQDLGMAYFETTDETLKKAYYAQAVSFIQMTREKLFAPYLSPLDKLRLVLDEVWESGAMLLDLGEGKMFSGLIRVLNDGVLAHEDKLERDHRCSKEDIEYHGQLGANIYLQCPKIGGELLVWNRSLEDAEYKKMAGNTYGINPALLGPYSASIKPESGDLIFFNPRNLHAVQACNDAELQRITISTFILYRGVKQPLRFWS